MKNGSRDRNCWIVQLIASLMVFFSISALPSLPISACRSCLMNESLSVVRFRTFLGTYCSTTTQGPSTIFTVAVDSWSLHFHNSTLRLVISLKTATILLSGGLMSHEIENISMKVTFSSKWYVLSTCSVLFCFISFYFDFFRCLQKFWKEHHDANVNMWNNVTSYDTQNNGDDALSNCSVLWTDTW